jgi:DNA-binding FadR family transcriptional regulator
VTTRARTLKRLERRPLLSQSVQSEIRAYIVENALKPGSALPSESEFARQLSVSRNSVREAVKSLQTVGLIEARVGSGLFVRAFSMEVMLDNLPLNIGVDSEEFTQAFAARAYLELGMSEDVVTQATEAHLKQLRTVVDAWRSASTLGKYLPQRDLEFHKALAAPANNIVVSRLLEMLWEVRNRARQGGAIPRAKYPKAQFERHEAIYQALRGRDLVAYRQAVNEHYAGSLREMAPDLETDPKLHQKIGPRGGQRLLVAKRVTPALNAKRRATV